MNALVSFLLVSAVLSGCTDQSSAGDGSNEVAPSPIEAFDKDRLWILMRASRHGEGRWCANYFLSPDQPQSFNKDCEAWAVHTVDYLRLNGMPTLVPAHIKDPDYWRWYGSMRARTFECRNEVLNRKIAPRDGAARAQKNRDSSKCDPYDDARHNYKKTPEDMGVVFIRKYGAANFAVESVQNLGNS